MSRLHRPTIPVEVKLRVALRQAGHSPAAIERVVAENPGRLGKFLKVTLEQIAFGIGCEVKELRLDHDPPLAARPRFRVGLGKTRYQPEANDPEHLHYRPHGPQHDGSHLVKTNVRGDHGQHPDRVLIKRERKLRREGRRTFRFGVNKPKPKPKRRSPPIRSRGFDKSKTKGFDGKVRPRG